MAPLHRGWGLGCDGCGNRTACPSRQARRRQRCHAGDRRYIATQERHAFGWCGSAICFGARQDRDLPDAGVADAGARRSARHAGLAVVSSRELDEQAGSVGASGCSGRISNGTSSPAAERRTRSRSLRGAILARASPSRAYDNDRLRLPPAPPSRNSEAEVGPGGKSLLSYLGIASHYFDIDHNLTNSWGTKRVYLFSRIVIFRKILKVV